MKNTQKKLKPKHFRYLSKKEIRDPDGFLKATVHQWGLNWAENFNYLINSSIYPPMRSNQGFEYGFMHLHLGQMIEMGYVILVKCKLDPTPKDRLFQYNCRELFVADIEDRWIFIEKSLCDFFGFKTLKEWYQVLHELSLSKDIRQATKEETYFDLEYIPIRELLVKLPKVLHEIHKRGGIQHCLPNEIVYHEEDV